MPRQRRDVPWLDTREGGVYYAFWYDPDTRRTRRHSLNTKVPGEAALAFATFLQHGADVYRSRAAGLTCGQALQDYLREHIEEKYVDTKRPRGTIANLSEHFGSLEVSKVEIQNQLAYRDRRMRGEIGTKPAKLSTVRRELGLLNAAIQHAVKWKRIPAGDAPVIERPDLPEQEVRVLSREDVQRLMDVASPRGKAFIMLAYYTASRRTAIETLTWFQVDLDTGFIKLAKPGERRTKKRRPEVPIDPELMPLLRQLWAERTNEYVLGSTTRIDHAWITACEKAGVDASPHCLRHSRATHLLEAGASLWAVASLLGDTVATVEKYYGHPRAEHVAEVLQMRRAK